nr:HAD family hydrolase [Lichenibacterium sp. 6Y81]
MTEPLRPAVFFDRDGVINADLGYVGDASRFALLPGAAAGVRAAAEAGALCFLVTNQSGVARGFYAEADVLALHRHMADLLAREGARFDDIRHCPHLPDAPLAAYRLRCACRKPEPGMILDLMARWPVDRARSALIGDKPSDMEAARAAGIRGVLYAGGPLADAVRAALAGV